MTKSSADAELLQAEASTRCNNNDKASWCSDTLPCVYDFPVNSPFQDNQMESGDGIGVLASEDFSKPNNWQEWADQLINEDDDLTPNWDELLGETNFSNPESKVGDHADNIGVFGDSNSLTFLLCHCRWHMGSTNHHQVCQHIRHDCIQNFLLHRGIPILPTTLHPQQIVLQPRHACAGHQNFMRLLWRLSVSLVAVNVCHCPSYGYLILRSYQESIVHSVNLCFRSHT